MADLQPRRWIKSAGQLRAFQQPNEHLKCCRKDEVVVLGGFNKADQLGEMESRQVELCFTS